MLDDAAFVFGIIRMTFTMKDSFGVSLSIYR